MAFSTQQFLNNIFSANLTNFNQLALEAFAYQYANNLVYKKYCNLIGVNDISQIKSIQHIPFLPISLFKSQQIISNGGTVEQIFTSSSTTNTGISKHYVTNLQVYHQSFINGFEQTFGSTQNFTILALLPGYLERNGSSLIYMVNHLMQISNKPKNGFYIYNFKALFLTIKQLEQQNEKYILFGVTHALVDFSEQFKPHLRNGIVIETGGMKGRKKELIREELYQILKSHFGLNQIQSEYGMTELLSQAYSLNDGKYLTPSWMKVLISEINDPFKFIENGKSGIINVIDLANINSCCFIQTADIGLINPNQTFEVLGRLDNSDLRGCSLMAI